MASSASQFRPEVRRALPTLVGVRFLLNTFMRMAYTFLPAFARGAGLSVENMSLVISARELTALSAPLTGKASDRLGPGAVMGYAGLVAAGGMLVATLGAPGLIIGFIVFGFGRTAYQVAMTAWIGDVVAYERRGRATGLIELTWGGAALLGLPAMGLLIDTVGWWAAPGLIGLLTLALSLRVTARQAYIARPTRSGTRKPVMSRAAVAAITTNAAMTAAAQFLFLGHGLWLEDTYGLDATEVGFAIVTVGAVEIIATTGSSRLTDRLGKRTSMLGGTVIMTVAMIGLALFSSPPLAVGLLLLVAAFLGFEFGIVSAIPLVSELDPHARAEMVGRAISVSTVTRSVITLVATSIYVTRGFATLMTVAAGFGVVAVLLAAFAMSEPDT